MKVKTVILPWKQVKILRFECRHLHEENAVIPRVESWGPIVLEATINIVPLSLKSTSRNVYCWKKQVDKAGMTDPNRQEKTVLLLHPEG